MNKKIIATSWHPGGINAIVPVIKRLNQDAKAGLSVIGYEFSEKVLDSNKIAYKKIGDYGLNEISPESMDVILEKENPGMILTGTSATDKNCIEKSIIYATKQRNIKSLAVLDFLEGNHQRFSNVPEGEKGKFKYLPDKIAIMDNLSEEVMLKEGFPKEKLAVTGNPSYDGLIMLKEKFNEEDRKKVKNDLKINLGSYLIVYASQPIEAAYGKKYGYTEKDILHDLLSSIEKLPNKEKMSLLVNVHPRENKEDLEKIARNYKLTVIIDKDYPIREKILASDAVISPWSTVLLESSYINKPSISLQVGLVGKDPLITNELGVTLPVYKQGEIGKVISNLLTDNNYRTELSQMAKKKGFSIDGKATERVTNLVYEMLGV